jgi:hypothetical protein
MQPNPPKDQLKPARAKTQKSPDSVKVSELVVAPEPEAPIINPPTVNGRPVTELSALISPAAFLVTRDGGTHEVTRCYYTGGRYELAGGGRSRLGQFECRGADMAADGRLTVLFSEGYVVSIPGDRIQATHRV